MTNALEQLDIDWTIIAATAAGLICVKRVSQKRSTCWGRSRSSATSLIVLNASGLLSIHLPFPAATARSPSDPYRL
jgi:hypothetical protein